VGCYAIRIFSADFNTAVFAEEADNMATPASFERTFWLGEDVGKKVKTGAKSVL